jgi:hypothetical protein
MLVNFTPGPEVLRVTMSVIPPGILDAVELEWGAETFVFNQLVAV